MKKIFLAVLFSLVLLVLGKTPAWAGTNLDVNCPGIGSCTISPANTPLYNESGWFPGAEIVQRLRLSNSSSQNGFSAVEVVNYSEVNNLGAVINLQIHKNSPVGPLIYSASSLHTFRDDHYFTLEAVNANTVTDYYFVADMLTTAGNEYQASMVKFDLNAGFELTASPPPSGGNTGGGGGVQGATTMAQPPGCGDPTPAGAPTVWLTNVGDNTVTLNWTPVSPVTHYGLFFTRISDGAQYGATNIGNVNTYTITSLSGGANYDFQVFGVNGCMPGPRSNTVRGVVTGPFINARPIGAGGQVLGTETATPSATPVTSPTPAGQILGEEAPAPCAPWKTYIPWILLVAQFLLIAFFEYRYRGDNGWTKHIIALATTALSIILFYLLRVCPCAATAAPTFLTAFLTWLCKWYWLVAIILSILIKGFSFAFLDESNDKEVPPAKSA